MFLAIRLGGNSLLQEPSLVKLEEAVLNNLSLLRGSRPSKMVKTDLEPIIDGLVLAVELVAKGLGANAGFERASFGRRAVLVSTTDVEGRAVAQLAVAAEDVGAECAPDNISEMRNVVHVRKGGRNEDVVFPPRLGEDDRFR